MFKIIICVLLLFRMWANNAAVTPPVTTPGICVTLPTLKRVGKYFGARHAHSTNSTATFQSCRLALAGDVHSNPGPEARAAGDQQRQAVSLQLVHQNVRSLRNKLSTLRSMAPELEKYHAIAFTETWLSTDVMTSELQYGLPNFTWFRKDRPTHGGGVACAVRTDLHPRRRPDLEACNSEMLVIQLQTTPAVYIAVCYCKPAPDGGILERTMSALHDIVTRCPAGRLIAVGDFNIPEIRWVRSPDGAARADGSHRLPQRATSFLDLCALAGFKQYVCHPTRGANILDLVLSSQMHVHVSVRDGTFLSDHSEVVCSFRCVKSGTPLVTRTSALNYRRADFEGMRRQLGLFPWSVIDDMDVNRAVELVYEVLENSISDHIPIVVIKRKFPPWFDRELKTLLKVKESAFRRLKRNRSEESEENFKQKRQCFKDIADRKYSAYISDLTNDLKTNPKRFWSLVKTTKGGSKATPTLSDNGTLITDDRGKASLLNRTFAGKFTEPISCPLPTAPSYDLSTFCNLECDFDTVRSILREIPVSKACGPDYVSARIIHECSDELAVPLTKIFKLSLNQGVFPDAWKRANVIPIHKKGSVSDPSNYRSVSLTPLFGKVLERLVYRQLLDHVRPVLSPAQHGFVERRSCVSNLATLLDTAWDSFSKQSQTDCIYTDYSSAFQSVDHRLLSHKLRYSFNLSGKAFAWIQSYLENRLQRVVVNGQCSDWTRVKSGTPEGGLLSPLLFSMFINDLPSVISKSNVLLFADDVKLFKQIKCPGDTTDLQDDLNKLCMWSKQWGLKLNPSKCKHFRMTLKKRPVAKNYSIGDSVLEYVSTIRDLGVILDETLTFGPHIDSCVKKANRFLGLLFRTFQKAGRRHSLNVSSVRVSYFAHVRSILEYGSVIWAGAAKTHLERLERVQHKFLIWLDYQDATVSASLSYSDLLQKYRMMSLDSRRRQHDLIFLRNIFVGRIDSSSLLGRFSLLAPPRSGRHTPTFNVPFARVDSVLNGLFVRLPREMNKCLAMQPGCDVFHDSICSFKTYVMKYATSIQ